MSRQVVGVKSTKMDSTDVTASRSVGGGGINKKSMDAKKRKLSISITDEGHKENNEGNSKKARKTVMPKSSVDVMVFKDTSNALINNQSTNMLQKLLKNVPISESDKPNILNNATNNAFPSSENQASMQHLIVKKNDRPKKTTSSQRKSNKKKATSSKHPNSMENKELPKEQQEAENLMKETKWRDYTIVDTNADDEATVAAAFHLPPFFEPSGQTVLQEYTDAGALTMQSVPVYVWPPPDRSVNSQQPGVNSSLRHGFVRSWGRTLPIHLIDVKQHPLVGQLDTSFFD